MYSQLYVFRAHTPIIRSIKCWVAAYGFLHRVCGRVVVLGAAAWVVCAVRMVPSGPVLYPVNSMPCVLVRSFFYLSVLCEKIQITKLLSFGPLWVMDTLFKERYKGREDEDDVSSCWVSVRKIYWNLKKKTLGRTVENSLWRWLRASHKTDYDRLSDWMNVVHCHLVWARSTATHHDVIAPKCTSWI